MLRAFFFCLCLLLPSPLLAAPPAEVVRTLYQIHLQEDRLDRTIRKADFCFTPGFLGVIERALARKPGPGGHVDVDFLTYSQGGWGDFEVDQTSLSGKEATVKLRVWAGLRSHGPDGPLPLAERKAMRKRIQATPVTIFLIDVGDGDGFQVRDIEFPAYDYKMPDGSTDKRPRFRVREWLQKIGQGR